MSDAKSHWDEIYKTKGSEHVSWFQREAKVSMDLITRVAPDKSARIIDVGGGASTLVDGLLATGYSNVSVLDLSASALAQGRSRLGNAAVAAEWIEGDILTANLPEAIFDLWHDRAVFHFLTSAADRHMYIEQVQRALRPGGHVIVATFAEDGPTRCSGLPVVRYSSASLHHEFDGGFELVESISERHVTPSGQTQSFVYCLCKFVGNTTTRAA
jgi:ubiquinone/menaquinone biosynthesis C-methylase UbiE